MKLRIERITEGYNPRTKTWCGLDQLVGEKDTGIWIVVVSSTRGLISLDYFTDFDEAHEEWKAHKNAISYNYHTEPSKVIEFPKK